MKKVVLWRDGRDVLVSLYYHSLFYNERGNRPVVDHTRSLVPFSDYTDIETNLPTFMEFVFSGAGKPSMTWRDFVDQWAGAEVVTHVKYEDLFDQCTPELARLVKALDNNVDVDAIARVAERYAISGHKGSGISSVPTSNDSTIGFVRKGGYGGWRDVFSREAAERFCELSGGALIKLGYEPDDAWVRGIGN